MKINQRDFWITFAVVMTLANGLYFDHQFKKLEKLKRTTTPVKFRQ